MPTLTELLHWLQRSESGMPVPIRHLVLDSRAVQPGDVFCAYPGVQTDGRHFINQAVRQGALAVLYDPADHFVPPFASIPMISVEALANQLPALASWFYQEPSLSLKMVGVTGTNGKTSITHLLAQALCHLSQRCGVLGTVGNGIWPHLQTSTLTTLDPLSLQRQLRYFVDQRVQTLAMEVSSHALAQGRLGTIQYDIGVFTNLTQDHLDFHGTLQHYANTKASFFKSHVKRVAILNADDPYAPLMVAQCSKEVQQIGYSMRRSDVAVYLESYQLHLQGMSLTVITPWGRIEAVVALLGTFNIANLLAVIAVLGSMGYAAADIARALQDCRGVIGRMEMIHQTPQVVIDYAHTPDALEKALLAVKAHCKNRLLVVFGCGGNRDRDKRSKMATIAERLADVVIVTEDNPRFEDPIQIRQDIERGFTHPEKIIFIENREHAIRHALTLASINDSILLAGKGHECYIIKKDQQLPFDERQIVKSVLHEFGRTLSSE